MYTRWISTTAECWTQCTATNIMSVPTLMFFRRGEVLWRESGLASYDHLVNVLRELEKREQVAQR